MRINPEWGRIHTLFFSPPGGFPAVANLGLEIVVDAVEKETHVPCDTIRSDLFLCRFVHPELLNKTAGLDAMDFFYADRVFPSFSSAERSRKRDRYLDANGLMEEDRRILSNALRKLEIYFGRRVREQRPIVLALSLNSDRLITALHFVRMARSIVPEIRVIFGGSVLRDGIGESVFATFPEIDYLVYGRGEVAAKELISRLYRREETDAIQGMLLSRSKVSATRRADGMDRSAYPLPEMKQHHDEIVRLAEKYGRGAFGTMYGIAVSQSVGCWWNRCDFCSEPFYHSGYALADPNLFARYINRIATRHHISDIFLLDSIQPPAPRLRMLCRRLKKDLTPYRISGEVHAGIDDETLDLLLDSGFKTLQIGIESYSQDLLDRMNKGIKLIDLFGILAKCAERQIAVQGNLLVHHPLETPEDVRATRNLMELTSHLFVPFLQHYFVARGSPLEKELKSRGIRTYPLMRHSLLYPRRLRDRLTFSYRYLPENKKTRAQWRSVKRLHARSLAERPVLMYIDGKDSIQVIDTRRAKRKSHHLGKVDRDLMIACARPNKISSIVSFFPGTEPELVFRNLERLVKMGLVLRQDERYLTLAIPWRNSRRPMA